MIYSVLFMPPFREGGAVFLLVSLIEQDMSKPKIYTLGLCQASKHSCKETTQCCGGCQLFVFRIDTNCIKQTHMGFLIPVDFTIVEFQKICEILFWLHK